jgi:hypothetical protein
MKKKMHILDFGGTSLAFSSLSAATGAMSALAKAVEVKDDTAYRDYTVKDESDLLYLDRMQLKIGNVDFPKPKKPLGLPAPRRNTLRCPFCEAVDVPRGSLCQSCGEYVG